MRDASQANAELLVNNPLLEMLLFMLSHIVFSVVTVTVSASLQEWQLRIGGAADLGRLAIATDGWIMKVTTTVFRCPSLYMDIPCFCETVCDSWFSFCGIKTTGSVCFSQAKNCLMKGGRGHPPVHGTS